MTFQSYINERLFIIGGIKRFSSNPRLHEKVLAMPPSAGPLRINSRISLGLIIVYSQSWGQGRRGQPEGSRPPRTRYTSNTSNTITSASQNSQNGQKVLSHGPEWSSSSLNINIFVPVLISTLRFRPGRAQGRN